MSKFLAGAILALGIHTASAIPTLTISDGTTTKTILDNGPLDGINAGDGWDYDGLGQVNWMGRIGNFNMTVTTALTKPEQGSELLPYLDISSSVSSGRFTSGGTLTFSFTEDGFTGNPLDMLASIGGTFASGNSSITYNTYYTDASGRHDLTGLSSTDRTFALEESSLLTSLSTPYSLTLEVILSLPGNSASSFDAQLAGAPATVPDGGATACLLGLGLGTLAYARRKTRE